MTHAKGSVGWNLDGLRVTKEIFVQIRLIQTDSVHLGISSLVLCLVMQLLFID
jgi:hypothetical protein